MQTKDYQRLRGPWREAPRQGHESKTWLSSDWVLQRRPITLINNTTKALEILNPLSHLPAFASARAEIIEVCQTHFFVLSPRLTGEEILEPKEGRFPDRQLFYRSLPEIAEALEKLHSLSLGHDSFVYPRNPVVCSLLASQSWVRESLRVKIGSGVCLPREPHSEMVVSHGDLALHNMLFGEGVYLFDWSGVCALPRHADAAYLVQSIIYRTPPETWPELLEQTAVLAPWLSLEEWQNSVHWALARSAATWPGWHPWREGVLAEGI